LEILKKNWAEVDPNIPKRAFVRDYFARGKEDFKKEKRQEFEWTWVQES